MAMIISSIIDEPYSLLTCVFSMLSDQTTTLLIEDLHNSLGSTVNEVVQKNRWDSYYETENSRNQCL